MMIKAGLKGVILGIASVGLFLVGTTAPVQAASKTVKLPSSLKGSWYGYLGKDENDWHRYGVVKLSLTKNFTLRTYTSKKKSLKPLRWEMTTKVPVTYTKKAKGVYRLYSRNKADLDSPVFISRKQVNVKVLGKKKMALKLRMDGENVYLFRQPLRSHMWTYSI
ncbi:hypothetical protein [Levilactobacillus yonginensis]